MALKSQLRRSRRTSHGPVLADGQRLVLMDKQQLVLMDKQQLVLMDKQQLVLMDKQQKEQNVLNSTFRRSTPRAALSLGALAASALLSAASSSWASIPRSPLPAPHTMTARDELLREQRLSQQMTELAMKHEGAPDFDSDLDRLSSNERKYRERLPGLSGHPRLRSVVNRVALQPYKPLRR